jgi:hypothetical protein
MSDTTNIVRLRQPDTIDDPLTDILRAGARKLLAQAIEIEAEAFLASMRDLKLADRRERLVRHGHGPEQVLSTWREVGAAGADIAITSAQISLPRRRRSHRARNRTRGREQRGTHWRKGDDGGVGSGCGSENEWREIAGPAGLI